MVYALLLFLNNIHEDTLAGQYASNMLSAVESAIEMAVEPQGKYTDVSPPLSPEMPVIELDGFGYVGYIEIPCLELKLPVMSDWDYERLKTAPCRQSGSPRTDDLVIAAHNYTQHFGRLKELNRGDTVIFTDMDGIINTYTVEALETVEPNALDRVFSSGSDLVLYTCTVGGAARVSVFCIRQTGS